MICQLFAVAAVSLAAVEVDVTPLEGDAASGTLVEFDARQLIIETAAGRKTFDSANLVKVTRKAAVKAIDGVGEFSVELTDGSLLSCKSYTVAQSKAAVELSGGEKIEFPTAAVHSVRFSRQEEGDLKAQWQAIDEREAAGDRIVIRKTSDAGVNLDWLEGVVYDVGEATVQFKYNGTLIPVKREKIEGVFYFHPAGGKLADPLCRVDDAAGSQWNVKSLALVDGQLELTSSANVKATLPVERLMALDYSGGKIVFLSEIDPDRTQWTPDFGRREPSPFEAQWFGPRSIEKFTVRELMLKNAGKLQRVDKGLLLHSRTELVYRVPDGFKRLLATTGIEANVTIGGKAQLVVKADGKTIFDEMLTAESSAPVPLDVDITGASRITILVDFGDQVGIGDQVLLSNVRMTK